jgi:hypothetical protein
MSACQRGDEHELVDDADVDLVGDAPVKFASAAQIGTVGLLAGQVKKIRLHTHELEDHVVDVVRGRPRPGSVTRRARSGPATSSPSRSACRTASSRRAPRRS